MELWRGASATSAPRAAGWTRRSSSVLGPGTLTHRLPPAPTQSHSVPTAGTSSWREPGARREVRGRRSRRTTSGPASATRRGASCGRLGQREDVTYPALLAAASIEEFAEGGGGDSSRGVVAAGFATWSPREHACGKRRRPWPPGTSAPWAAARWLATESAERLRGEPSRTGPRSVDVAREAGAAGATHGPGFGGSIVGAVSRRSEHRRSCPLCGKSSTPARRGDDVERARVRAEPSGGCGGHECLSATRSVCRSPSVKLPKSAKVAK